mmetsp:Transcript_3372/g.12111  ORF Transcript_3372/g.12111 Transcript_3372/m.12111 type:complete len:203 (+) Transcript_3372:4240-4848(+)
MRVRRTFADFDRCQLKISRPRLRRCALAPLLLTTLRARPGFRRLRRLRRLRCVARFPARDDVGVDEELREVAHDARDREHTRRTDHVLVEVGNDGDGHGQSFLAREEQNRSPFLFSQSEDGTGGKVIDAEKDEMEHYCRKKDCKHVPRALVQELFAAPREGLPNDGDECRVVRERELHLVLCGERDDSGHGISEQLPAEERE